MRNKVFKTTNLLKLLLIIPLLATVIIMTDSCSGTKKSSISKVENTIPPSEVFVVVEEMPVFPGGDEALIKFISTNIKYPEEAKAKNITGRIIIRFCVNYDGTVDRITVLKGVDPSLDQEAIRVIKLLPKWQPGKQGGKPVNVWYSIPVSFGLSPDSKIGPQNYTPPRFIVQNNDTIYLSVKEKPQFPGGGYALYKFKSDNLKYPDAAKSNNLVGTVAIQFIVNENGSLSALSITSGISPSLDAEALRVAKLMPDWQPGKENGKAVKVRTSTSFNFELPSSGGPSNTATEEVFVVVEEMPRFPGGDSVLMKFIAENVQYPKNAKEKGIQGRVILRFCVTYEGNISKVGVLKGVDPDLDAEAIRVIKTLPKWQPGMQGGKPVNVYYAVPISFKLDGPGKPAEAQNQNVPPPPPPPPSPPVPPVPSLPAGYDEVPVFIGGESAIFKFIQSNLVYPQEAKAKGITGTIAIRFCISETGVVENINISESGDPLLDQEALRVVKLLPAWQPGKLKGTPVKVWYTIPVTFKLN